MTNISKILSVCVAILMIFSLSCGTTSDWSLQDGDIVFQTSLSPQSIAIEKATHSRYSHMGLIIHMDGVPYVFEAVQTVRYTPWDAWVARGKGGHFVVKRLKETNSLSTQSDIANLGKTALTFQDKPYDLTFEWSDDRIYCSELVWKIYKRTLGLDIGGLKKLKDFDLEDVAVKAKLRERYGDDVPLEETVISPGDMFSSDLLMTVFAN